MKKELQTLNPDISDEQANFDVQQAFKDQVESWFSEDEDENWDVNESEFIGEK